MAVNKYFNHITNTKEQDFFEDFVVESIKVSGIDVWYLVREHEVEAVLQEPTRSDFNHAYLIEAYFHDVQGFGGEGDLMSKFGFQQPDTLELSIAKRSWRALKIPDRLERPREGDLIYLPFSKSMFEITFVEHEDPFWQLGRYNVFRLKTTMYTRGYNEKFNTGVVADSTGHNPDGAGNTDNTSEIDDAINNAIKTKSNVLIDFTEKNPFGGM